MTQENILLQTATPLPSSLNPQVVYSWKAPLRAYKKRSKYILRFYIAVALLLSIIIIFLCFDYYPASGSRESNHKVWLGDCRHYSSLGGAFPFLFYIAFGIRHSDYCDSCAIQFSCLPGNTARHDKKTSDENSCGAYCLSGKAQPYSHRSPDQVAVISYSR